MILPPRADPGLPAAVLVDVNVLLDVFMRDSTWYDWSARSLAEAAETTTLVIDPIVYAEASVRFATIEELEEALPAAMYRREPLPWEAAFLAGKAHVRYRRRGGPRRSPLPDFCIGAHAAVRGYALLTRDGARYRTYFPALRIVAPDGAP